MSSRGKSRWYEAPTKFELGQQPGSDQGKCSGGGSTQVRPRVLSGANNVPSSGQPAPQPQPKDMATRQS